MKREYGIAREEYEALLKRQNGRCAICKRLPGWEKKKKRLSVDHDHVSGAVRGLLCGTCNTGLGHLGDDVLTLESALEYLRHANTVTK